MDVKSAKPALVRPRPSRSLFPRLPSLFSPKNRGYLSSYFTSISLAFLYASQCRAFQDILVRRHLLLPLL
jgi:hypothetical protein